MQLIECVPNFSEGRNQEIINNIADEIRNTPGVKLIHIDTGVAANRTVMTFIGSPEAVCLAAYKAIIKAAQLIDMRTHKGEHPRIGATDVCPFIPVSNITNDELHLHVHHLVKKLHNTVDIPIYLYEQSATVPERKNLANIRKGEYEGLEEKMKNPKWKPDYGGQVFNPKTGATVIGVRNFLLAYNVNLDTKDAHIANEIAKDIREKGRTIIKENCNKISLPGLLKSVKAIGWYIRDFDKAQISMNLTDMHVATLHHAYEACISCAKARGINVTGSELIGMVPKKALLDAGNFYLQRDHVSRASDLEIMQYAVTKLGLDELSPFDIKGRVLED
jgi:glutamate formiminotransferase / formiminotetrahydrofolate cyclodeaminase